MFAPLTRAPHLLLRTFTGCSSVRLFRFHVAWSTHAGRGEISAFFRFAVQRYVNEMGFCKFFGEKVQKKWDFGDFWVENDDFLE